MYCKVSLERKDVDKLSQKLQSMNSVRFDAVKKKNITEIFNRARSPGGTPQDSDELRKSSAVSGDEMGYLKEYGPHVEYGHRTTSGGFVQGQHFLQQNVDAQRPIYKQDLIDAIRKG